MKKEDFTYDTDKLALSFDENGNAVWSFTAVKEGVKCKKIEIARTPLEARSSVRKSFEGRMSIPLRKTFTRLENDITLSERIKKELKKLLERHLNPTGKKGVLTRNKFVRRLAQNGALNNHFNAKVIALAKLFGFVPRGYQIHHKIPIHWNGTNEDGNLVLIQNKLHGRLHQLTTDLLQKAYKLNKSKLRARSQYIIMPVLPKVLTRKNITDYFNGFEDLALPARSYQAPAALVVPPAPATAKAPVPAREHSPKDVAPKASGRYPKDVTPRAASRGKGLKQRLSQGAMPRVYRKKVKKASEKEAWYSAVFKQRGRNAS